MKKIELLAPAGSYEAFLAAANNGADAIYIAGKNFGARSYANNFTDNEILELIKYAHIRDVKVYVVINTIVFDNEWPELVSFLDFLYTSDVDALIVQDLGVLLYIKENYPSFIIHASTQMNIHISLQAQALKDFGVKRIVLAREVDLSSAKQIKEDSDLEIEVFGHGALCVSYSGNCLMSSLIGKRSGNRGRCAQPCRLPYQINDNNEEQYYLSTKDLFTLDKIDMLIKEGVDSIKIEGRMKRPEYVAQVVRTYRKAIDAYYLNESISLANESRALEEVFNREFTKGFLFNEENDNITNITSPNHKGKKIGRVIGNSKETIDIKLDESLSINDSIRIVGKNTFGFTISKMLVDNQDANMAQKGQVVRVYNDNSSSRGDLIYRTKSARQIEDLAESISQNYKKIPLTALLFLKEDYLVLRVSDKKNTINVKSQVKVQKATSINLTNTRLVEQINKTQDTPFIFTEINLDLPYVIFLPIKEINDLRRRALDELSEKRSKWHNVKQQIKQNNTNISTESSIEFLLKAKVRTQAQLDKVIEVGYKHIYLSDFNLLKEYEKKYPDIIFYHYMDRINPVAHYKAEHKVISDIGNINLFKTGTSSIYLNIVNSYAVYYLISKGVKTIGLSPEISKIEIKDLISDFKTRYQFTPNLELNCYGYQEVMLIRHDFLSKAGIAAEDNYLTDRKGFKFRILKEVNYLKILNSQRLHLIDYLDEIKELGINSIYLDFTIEDPAEVEDIARMYLNAYLNKQYTKTSLSNASFGHFREGVL